MSKTKAQALSECAERASSLLKLLANENRLLILCRLVEASEMNVTQLSDSIGLTQSALSQHLAKMRRDGLVAYRREGQMAWYRISDPATQRLLGTLHDLFAVDRNGQTQIKAGELSVLSSSGKAT